MVAKNRNIISLKDSFCLGCNRMHDLTEFYESDNLYHANAVSPYCKNASREIMTYYFKQTGKLETALYFTCSIMGYPFLKEVFEAFKEKLATKKNIGNSTNYFEIYYKEFKAMTNFEDEESVDFTMTDIALSSVTDIKKSEASLKLDMEGLSLVWGSKDIADLQFLEYRYEVYTRDVLLTPAQETLYRQLCLVELSKRQKESLGDTTNTEQKMILDLMSKLKIDNFAVTQEKSDIDRMLEGQIAEMEKNMPCEIYDQKELYKDYCGIGAYWNDYILRPVKNLLTGSKDYPTID